MRRLTAVSAIVAIVAAAVASSSSSEPLAPQVIELEAAGNHDTPRFAVSISSARAHPSGYLQSTIRVVSRPAGGSYYFASQCGIRLGTPGRSAGLIGLGRLCQGKPVVWVYSNATLKRMQARGAYFSAFLRVPPPGSPCCPYRSVRGRIDVERLARRVRTVARPLEHAVLDARLTPDELTHEPRDVPARARGTFHADVWPWHGVDDAHVRTVDAGPHRTARHGSHPCRRAGPERPCPRAPLRAEPLQPLTNVLYGAPRRSRTDDAHARGVRRRPYEAQPPRRAAGTDRVHAVTRGSAQRLAASAVALVLCVAPTACAAPDEASPTRMTAVLRSGRSGEPARGRFYARIARHGDRAELNFNFTYSSPSRWPYPGTAHIHLGRPRGGGRIVIQLCPASARCGFGFVWSEGFRSGVLDLMRTRGAYVELHPTVAPHSNALVGEIRLR